MNQISSGFTSIQQVTDQYLNTTSKSSNMDISDSFASYLQNQLDVKEASTEGEVKFSKHAAKRLDDRDIQITEEQKIRLNEGVQKAEAKGIQDSLVMVDSLAFIVNVPSNTVITALENNQSEEGIFTNIDGAVIA
ncbi:MAG: flagellar protein [Lachnospiraceae bacterium]|nr:flagellar protein [Lachnospiraceae bacterium]